MVASNLLKLLRREKKALILSLIISLIITLILSATKGYSESIQSGISSNVIRFHIIANSDNDYDQSLKLLVRDSLLDDLNIELQYSHDLELSREFIINSLDKIKSCVEKVVKENGYSYNVKVELKKNVYFPSKQYGDISFPAGNYEALQITIGEGKGKNWWCVVFPPLCYVDVTHKVVSDDMKKELKNILTDEEYNIVLNQDSEKSYKIKFKIIEWWQKLKNKDIYFKAVN